MQPAVYRMNNMQQQQRHHLQPCLPLLPRLASLVILDAIRMLAFAAGLLTSDLSTDAAGVQTIRPMYSSPPAHGARIAATILKDPALYEQWRVSHGPDACLSLLRLISLLLHPEYVVSPGLMHLTNTKLLQPLLPCLADLV